MDEDKRNSIDALDLVRQRARAKWQIVRSSRGIEVPFTALEAYLMGACEDPALSPDWLPEDEAQG